MSRLGGFHILLKLIIKFFNHEALMSRKTHWIKYFGPPLVQLGACQGRIKEVAIKTQVVKWSILACVVIRARCFVFLLRAKWVCDLRYVGISGGRCNFDAKNVWLAKNWKIFEFAPLARPSSYLKKEEEHNRRPKKKSYESSRFFRIRAIKSQFNCCKFMSIFKNHFLVKCNRAA